MSSNWQELTVAPDQTHHLHRGVPAYEARFDAVLKFHSPGLAPVRDSSGAYHIDAKGKEAYAARYLRTFGYYGGRAAAQAEDGWFHILADGSRLYPQDYAWCGNFQEGRCTVRHFDGKYAHIREDGIPAYEARYRYAGDYHDGSAVVQQEDGLHTHVDWKGNLLHGRWFRDLDVFHKGFARACDATGWHHVDARGQPAYGWRFKAVEPFYNGQARVEDFDGVLWVIDEAGQTIARLRDALESSLNRLSTDLVGFWRTQTIRAAVELGVFEALPISTPDLDRQLALSSTASRLLRALAELDLVYQDNGGVWHPTEQGSLLTRVHDLSMVDAVRLWSTDHYTAWTGLADALRSGRSTFEDHYGKSFFQWLSNRPNDLGVYHGAMSSYARHDYRSIPQVIDFSKHRKVLDAGGGRGELLFSLLREAPRLQGILMDRPEVVARACIPEDLVSRCQVKVGDLFTVWPPKVDAIILARILHDWPDDQASIILRHARSALIGDGRLYLLEALLDESIGAGGMLDLNMLVMTGGRERTEAEFKRLLSSAGFRVIDRRETPSVVSALIAEPV